MAVVFLVVGLSQFARERGERRRLGGAIMEEPAGKREGRGLLRRLADRFDASRRGERVRLALAQANLQLKPSDYAAIQVVTGLAVFVLAHFLGAPVYLSFSFGIISGKYGFHAYVVSRKRARVLLFESKLPDAVRMLANSMRAGMSLSEAMKSIRRDLEPPVDGIFEGIIQKMQMGASFEAAVQEQLALMPSKELQVLFAAISMQAETGGNLVACLSSMGETLRDRKQLLREVKVQTSEAKFTSAILPVLPLGIVLLLNLLFPGYLAVLLTVPGMILVGILVGGIGVSYLMIRSLTQFEV